MIRSFACSVSVAAAALALGLAWHPMASAASQSSPPPKPAAPAGTQPATKPATPPPPAAGDKAPGFRLQTPDDKTVEMTDLLREGNLVLVVLRGWPGYQCPISADQLADFIEQADLFKAAGATVVFVYPGPADGLKDHAKEFLEDIALPEHFRLVVDPDYVFTNAWRLRWDQLAETAHPATFVIDPSGVVRFANVSKDHHGRVKADEAIKALQGVKPAKS